MTLEEQKKLIAEKLMGWTIDFFKGERVYVYEGDYKNKTVHIFSDEFKPEKGGKDLTEVLKKVDLKLLLSELFDLPIDFDDEETAFMELMLWFQDDTHAPSIVKAIAETIEANNGKD